MPSQFRAVWPRQLTAGWACGPTPRLRKSRLFPVLAAGFFTASALMLPAGELVAQDLRFVPAPEKQPAAPPEMRNPAPPTETGPGESEPSAAKSEPSDDQPGPRGPAPLIRAAEPISTAPVTQTAPTERSESAGQSLPRVAAPLVVGPSMANLKPEPNLEKPRRSGVDESKILPASFNGLIPGRSSESEVAEVLGEPEERLTRGKATVFQFRPEPFRRVEISIVEGVVASIAIHLPQAESADVLAERLKIDSFDAVNVPDETGRPLGRVYPERAVLFAFATGATEKNPLVSQVLLEPIGPEPFVLRAWHGPGSRLSDRLADLEYALSHEPNDAKAHWLRAVLSSAVGNESEAMAAAAQAAHLDPEEPRFQLTLAELQTQLGIWSSAERTARKLADDPQIPPEIAARAMLLLGDIAGRGEKPNLEKAIALHQEAIRRARPLVDDDRVGIRRLARQTLLDAHLAITRDVAWGRFQRKHEAIDRWAAQANELVEQMIEQDQGPRLLRLKLHRDVLSAYAVARTEADPSAAADDAIEEAKRAIQANDDPLLRRHVEWLLGEVLTAAMQIEQQRGKKEAALRLAGNAVALLEASLEDREPSPRESYTLAKLRFRIGSIYAVLEDDHLEAAKWYQLAIPTFEQPVPAAMQFEQADQGERFVSMGVSYWKAGLRPRGLELTVEGVELLELAAGQGVIDQRSLAIPYGNLASMYKQLGHTEKARNYAELAARLEPEQARQAQAKPNPSQPAGNPRSASGANSPRPIPAAAKPSQATPSRSRIGPNTRGPRR